MPEEPTPLHSDDSIVPKERVSTFWREVFEFVRNTVVVLIIVGVSRSFLFQPFVVSGSSMEPNLQTNDYLIVDKATYHFKTPERGDVIVFKYPYNLSVNYVKRVIGLPGETVRITDGKVLIVNKDHPDGVALDETYLPEELKTTLFTGAANGEFPVPSEQYFVLGDNRGGSADSRVWGYLPKADIIGRAFVRLYPWNSTHKIPHARYSAIASS